MSKVKYVEWDSQFVIGVSKIDKQHKKLINLLNDTIKHSNGNKKDEKKYFKLIRVKSEKYLKKHFDTEEKMLAKTKYDKLKEHKAEHNKFYNTILKLNEDIDNNVKEINLFDSTAFIKEWLLNHIRTFDKKADKYIVEWVKSNK